MTSSNTASSRSAHASVKTDGQRRLVSLVEAAAFANVHTRTIRRYVAAGRLAAYRCGPRLIRVDVPELEGLLRPIPTAGFQQPDRRPRH
jgi:excisionase family DNA binding protein